MYYESYAKGELPPYVRDALENWPQSGSGNRLVHRHILKLANLVRHYVAAEVAAELIRGNMPRRAKAGEIEEAIELAYNLESTPNLDRAPPQHLANPRLIEQVVAERFSGGSMLEELRRRSPFPIPDSTDQIVRTLFPPDSLICVAGAIPEYALTAPLRNFSKLDRKEFIVPSPMSDLHWIDKKGGTHKRGLANTGPRRFIVTDFDIKKFGKRNNPTIFFDLIKRWEAAGVSIQDAAAALICHLNELGGPLAMVVYSGNVSLQAWWFCEGEDESIDGRMRAFFETAVILGADRAGWTTCQFFRMPGGLRSNTDRRQDVHFFNPSAIR
jgi:hypothetical protein